jgi:deoxycytidylate deaminase
MRHLTGPDETDARRWMEGALNMARRARCQRAKCGAVIVAGGVMIGEGYNAPPLDREEHRVCGETFPPGKPKYDRTCCVHAEWRAIFDAFRRSPAKLEGSRLFFARLGDDGAMAYSGRPFCTVCSRLALDAGIAEFLLWHEDGITAYETGEYNRLSYAYEHPAAA